MIKHSRRADSNPFFTVPEQHDILYATEAHDHALFYLHASEVSLSRSGQEPWALFGQWVKQLIGGAEPGGRGFDSCLGFLVLARCLPSPTVIRIKDDG